MKRRGKEAGGREQEEGGRGGEEARGWRKEVGGRRRAEDRSGSGSGWRGHGPFTNVVVHGSDLQKVLLRQHAALHVALTDRVSNQSVINSEVAQAQRS